MTATTRLDIDLAFSLTEPFGVSAASESAEAGSNESSVVDPLSGTVTASGLDVAIYVSRPELFVRAAKIKLKDVRGVAAELAQRGLSVSVTGPDGLIVRLGSVPSSVTQRVLTGSPHIRLGNGSALKPLLRNRAVGVTEISAVHIPPSTLFPLIPTFDRTIRRRVTTTHSEFGAGRPRLIFVVGSTNWNGQKPREFTLLPGITTIGSSPSADLQLEGLEPFHAEIRHDDSDEYVLYSLAAVEGGSAENSDARVLRTGSRIQMGQWRIGYFREEYADHGRPHGGRQGGELAYQKPQPSRPAQNR
ncbi:MAG: FHA domain-containing protein [Microbacteriaceae bacterium]